MTFTQRSKLDPEIEKLLRELSNESYRKGVKYGGNFIIKTLREAMEVSGLPKVEPMWLDTAERKLNERVKT